MVRLKEIFKKTEGGSLSYFNSTMVRLKDVRGHFYCGIVYKFQFHYGSVKRSLLISFVLIGLYFNSTMVRLKGWSAIMNLTKILYFNSTMVRLKVHTLLISIGGIYISIPLWFG